MERVFAASKAEAPPNAIRHTSCEYEIKLIDLCGFAARMSEMLYLRGGV